MPVAPTTRQAAIAVTIQNFSESTAQITIIEKHGIKLISKAAWDPSLKGIFFSIPYEN